MDSTTFMGLLIASLISLFALAGTVTTLIIKPVINLNKTMVKLDASIKDLNKTANGMENRLDKHDQEFENINKDLRTMDGRITRIEAHKL